MRRGHEHSAPNQSIHCSAGVTIAVVVTSTIIIVIIIASITFIRKYIFRQVESLRCSINCWRHRTGTCASSGKMASQKFVPKAAQMAQSAILSAPAAAPIPSKSLLEARTRAKEFFREVSSKNALKHTCLKVCSTCINGFRKQLKNL